ncbi:MAG: SDR family NAD(P)-dependent oxidoreductase [Henriciella sp.]|jgi:NAD(P)-dependent dehydrogenase (short-subunit alcohol dehydrogenase family)
MKSVVITGASTGIGRATAEYLAERGWQVFAGVRSATAAETLKDLSPRIDPIILDVTQADHIGAAVDHVSQALAGETLTGLVNNAGVAVMGPLALQPVETFSSHFDVNVIGLLRATQGFLPLLGMDRFRSGPPGRIINITSVGGRLASPFLGAYTATKHAVESMTDSLRRELVIYGIDAIAVGPGAVQTPIWDKAEEANQDEAYSETAWADGLKAFSESMLDSGRKGLPADRIAHIVATALTTPRPKARYAPVPDKLTNFTLPLLLPKRVVDRVFGKRLGLVRK